MAGSDVALFLIVCVVAVGTTVPTQDGNNFGKDDLDASHNVPLEDRNGGSAAVEGNVLVTDKNAPITEENIPIPEQSTPLSKESSPVKAEEGSAVIEENIPLDEENEKVTEEVPLEEKAEVAESPPLPETPEDIIPSPGQSLPTPKDKFSEELFLQPLSSGHLSSVFKLTTVWSADVRQSSSWAHYNLFPRSLGEIIAAFHVQELRLSLTAGYWRHAHWGHPLDPAPPGALVTARILPTAPDVDAAWTGLTSALAGLLCASLNTLDKTQAVEPQYSFQPRGVVGPGLSSNSSYLRYGVLPKENLCTENLTPWKKLLPCKSRRGLATLLSAGHINKFSSFQSLSLTFRPVCTDPACRSLGVELSQAVTLVFDPAVFNGRPDMADWSLKQLFGIGVGPPCPLADISQVYVDITDGKFVLSPPPQRTSDLGRTTTFFKADLRKIAVYDSVVHAGNGIKNIKAVYSKPHIYGIIPAPVLTVSRHVVGTGNERGGIVSTITNNGPDSLHVVYLDTIPWFLRLYLHTMKITSNGVTLTPITVHYVPGVDRQRPYSLEVVLRLPPKSSTTLRVDFEYSMLRWMEYPPDANHGFYVASAVVTARLPSQRNVTFLSAADSTVNYVMDHPEEADDVVQIFTEILLVALPTPDFSMPYNVICLACTVIALAFGPLHNITTRTLTVMPPGQEDKSILGKVLDKVKKVFGKGDVSKKTKDNEEDEKESEGVESTNDEGKDGVEG